MTEQTTAQAFKTLASMDIAEFGYVQKRTASQADTEAIGGRKTPTGYIFEYSDGSLLDFNKFTLEMEAL